MVKICEHVHPIPTKMSLAPPSHRERLDFAGLPAPESASAAPAAPSPAAWPGSAAPPDARPGRTLRCQERWDITVT